MIRQQPPPRRTPKGTAATRIVLQTFRLNGLLLKLGDRLAGAEGLNAARWQVLGAVALAGRPLTVPQIARRMGLARQSVHATVNRLVEEGLLTLEENRDHLRSRLVELTKKGHGGFEAMDRRQTDWVNDLAEPFALARLRDAAEIVEGLSRALESEEREPEASVTAAGR